MDIKFICTKDFFTGTIDGFVCEFDAYEKSEKKRTVFAQFFTASVCDFTLASK